MARTCRQGWDAVVEEFHASGLGKTEFAQRRGIPLATLRRWIERAAAARPAGPPALLPVGVVAAPAPAPKLQAPREAPRVPLVEVTLRDGVVVRCLVGTDVGYVGALVERLR